jgi:hypothetical protein
MTTIIGARGSLVFHFLTSNEVLIGYRLFAWV